MKTLITGVAGFIGMHVAKRLLERGDEVVGVDDLNDYYDVGLKEARLRQLAAFATFRFVRLDISDTHGVAGLFREERFEKAVNIAAQVGVRYSVQNPGAYVRSNLVGFANMLEACRHGKVEHLVYASSSSVYGGSTRMPFSERDSVDHPVSLYAATKKSNELMAHSYAHLYGLPCTGLRFFTVYGPWGRPDMALFKFTRAILEGKPIQVFNNGNMVRDFTYIDDIVEGVARVIDRPPRPDPSWKSDSPNPASSKAPYRLFNIGNSKPVPLMRYIEVLEQSLGKKAEIEMMPMQAGDMQATLADVSGLEADLGYRPRTAVEEGVPRFVEWYRSFYHV